MIAEFRVKNFFSIKDEQCLSFEATNDSFMNNIYSVEVKKGVSLLKIGMIYGANASGKTNILLALSFFKKLLSVMPKDKTKKIRVMPFMLDNSSRSETTKISMCFYLNQERYVLSVEFDNIRIYEEILLCYPGSQPAKLYNRKYNNQTDSAVIEFGNKLGLSKTSQKTIIGNTINNSTVMAAFGKSNVESTRLNIVYEFFSHGMKETLIPRDSLSVFIKTHLDQDKQNDNSSTKTFLISMLKAADFNICDLMLKKEEKLIDSKIENLIHSAPIPERAKQQMLQAGKITNHELVFKHKTNNGEFELPEELESSGTMRFMGMSIILKQLLENNNIVMIDEIENSLHYELLSYFIKVFLANSEKYSQLIATTHDINLLNEDFIRRDSIWFTDKDKIGQTNLIRLSSLGLHKNLSPYYAYKQGKLVDLPFFDSIYLKDDKLCEDKK